MHGNTKHGHYKGDAQSPTVLTWVGMIRRCYNGFRVPVDPYWLDFSNFLSDMGERPNGYTLDRINPNLGYTKNNCRWVCPAKQQHNRRDTKLSWEKIDRIKWMRDEGFFQKQIAAELGVAQPTISRVLSGRRWKPELPVVKQEDAT